MAGGEGTRLRPLTSNQPKPMMPMANRPLMEHVVRRLALHGIDDIVVTVAFLASHIRNYFGDGSELGVSMRYATEETPLGTAGSVRNAAAELDDTFMVISGDVLSDIDLDAVIKAHRSSGALATIALRRVENPVDFGIVITNAEGWVERFLEKPTWGQVFSDTINTGIYVLEPQILDLIPEHESVDFSEMVFPAALQRGMAIQGLVVDGYWEDVGTIDAYHRAHRDVLDERVAVDIPGFRLGDGIWLGEGADVDPAAEITGPGHHRGQLPDRSRGPHRRVHRARLQRGGEARRRPVPHGRPRPRLHRAGARRCGAASSAARPTCGGEPGPRRASSSARSASSATTPSSTRASRSTPTRPSSRAPSSTRRSCGRAGASARCSAAGA